MDTIHKLAAILHKSEPASESGSVGPATSYDEIVLKIMDFLQTDNTGCFREFFECLEQELIFNERPVQDSIIIELLEGLKNHATWRDIDYVIFENWLGPETHVAWRWLEKKWQGKKSLVDTTRTSSNR